MPGTRVFQVTHSVLVKPYRDSLPVQNLREDSSVKKRQCSCRAAAQQSLGSTRELPAQQRDPETSRQVLSAHRDAAEAVNAYAELKTKLLNRAQRAGGFLALYLFLQQGLTAALCSALGTATGWGYLQLLARDVEQYTAESDLPLNTAQQIAVQPLRGLAIGIAAYRQALRPRLLVPIMLGALVGAYNTLSQDPLTNLLIFDMLLGFLCYKAGLFLQLYDDVKPKFDPALLTRPIRPVLADLPNPDEEEQEKRVRSRQRHD